MILPRLVALVPLLAALPALAQGAPRSIGECERLKNDLAYNQCLALFGPAARNVAGGFASAEPAAAAALPTVPQAEEAAEAPAERHGRSYRARRGRQSAVFTVGSLDARSYRHRRRRY